MTQPQFLQEQVPSVTEPFWGWGQAPLLLPWQPGVPKGTRGDKPMASLSPPLSLPGLHIFAIAFALEVSVGKTNTVMALNNSNVLLPCTFITCIGFQDLVFTWYFNSTELVGGSLGSASAFLAGPFVLPQRSLALQFSLFPFSSCRMECPSLCHQLWAGQGCANGVIQIPQNTCAFGTELF